MRMWDEFKTFAFKGNMIDLAVGVIIGTAFGKVVGSLVNDLIMPTISHFLLHMDYDKWAWEGIPYGKFIGALLDFLIVALVVFLIIVKLLGALMKRAKPAPGPAEPVTKECPRCLMVIPIKATRCGHCTSDLG